MIRRHVYYSGRVQGVGFRFTAQRLARQLAVTGWVRNLPDGRVEMIVESERLAVDTYLARLAEVMGRNIESIQQNEEPASGGFQEFKIVC